MDSKKIRLLLNTVLILAFLVVFRDFVVYKRKSQTYQQQITDLKDEIARLKKEEQALREKVSRLESDPLAIEKRARERFNMLKPGEELIPPDTDGQVAAPAGRPPRR